VEIELNGITYKVYVAIRQGVKEFLDKMSEIYELVVFTASLAKYANPVLDYIDPD